jgi:hypothetical protein
MKALSNHNITNRTECHEPRLSNENSIDNSMMEKIYLAKPGFFDQKTRWLRQSSPTVHFSIQLTLMQARVPIPATSGFDPGVAPRKQGEGPERWREAVI